MQKTITISVGVDEEQYSELNEQAGEGNINNFLEELLLERISIVTGVYRTDAELEAGYRAMAEDEEHEREALEWSEALAGDGIR